MTDNDTSALEGQISLRDKQIEALEAELKTARLAAEAKKTANEQTDIGSAKLAVEVATLQAQIKVERATKAELQTKIEGLTTDVEKLTSQLTAAKSENLGVAIKRVIDGALRRGVDAAIFEGSEQDPVRWMKSTFASFESFDEHVSHLRGRKNVSVSSGSRDDETDSLSASTVDQLKRLGLDPKYALISRESDLSRLNKG